MAENIESNFFLSHMKYGRKIINIILSHMKYGRKITLCIVFHKQNIFTVGWKQAQFSQKSNLKILQDLKK